MSRGGDLVEEKKDQSKAATYDELASFNDSIKRLIHLMRSDGRTASENESNEADFKEQWKGCVRMIDNLLWPICLNRTNNVELACYTVVETRFDFIKEINAHSKSKSLWKWAVNEWNTWLVPFNVWLFIQAKRKIEALEAGHQRFMMPPSSVSLAADDLIAAARRIAEQPSPKQCPLRGYAERIKEKIGQQTAEIRRQLSSGNCRKTCDLILLVSCGFRMAEVSLSLGVDKSWPALKLDECMAEAGTTMDDIKRSGRETQVPGKRSN